MYLQVFTYISRRDRAFDILHGMEVSSKMMYLSDCGDCENKQLFQQEQEHVRRLLLLVALVLFRSVSSAIQLAGVFPSE